MNSSDAPVPDKGFYVTHFLTVRDQNISSKFYTEILGGKIILEKDPCIIKLANSWIILNVGGGPTPDKPNTTLEAPHDSKMVSSFLNLRVADIQASYKDWKAKGAIFFTEPLDNHGWELRCYMKDPDGYIIEVGQSLQKSIDIINQMNK